MCSARTLSSVFGSGLPFGPQQSADCKSLHRQSDIDPRHGLSFSKLDMPESLGKGFG